MAVCAAMAEVLRSDVAALHERRVDVGPVDREVVVGDARVRALAVLGLDGLELGDRALAGLVEQTLLDICRELDRPDAEVAADAVELDLATRAPGVFL